MVSEVSEDLSPSFSVRAKPSLPLISYFRLSLGGLYRVLHTNP